MWIYILIAAICYLFGVYICLYYFTRQYGSRDGSLDCSFLWPVWVPFFVVLYLPFMLGRSIVEIAEEDRERDIDRRRKKDEQSY